MYSTFRFLAFPIFLCSLFSLPCFGIDAKRNCPMVNQRSKRVLLIYWRAIRISVSPLLKGHNKMLLMFHMRDNELFNGLETFLFVHFCRQDAKMMRFFAKLIILSSKFKGHQMNGTHSTISTDLLL